MLGSLVVGVHLQAHMLFLAHLERLDDEVPAALKPDLAFVLQKTPLLLEEIVKIALLPRPPVGYGWMVSAVNKTDEPVCCFLVPMCKGMLI